MSMSMSMSIGVYQLVAKGDISVLRSNEGLDLKALTAGSKNSILHIAARYGQLNFIDEALNYLPSYFVNQDNDEGDTPLHLAAMHGHDAVARLLAFYHTNTDSDIDSDTCLVRNKAGDTPLHVALRYGHLNVADQILTANCGLGSLVNETTRENPLHLVLRYCSGILKSTSLAWSGKKGAVKQEGFLSSRVFSWLDEYMLKTQNLNLSRSTSMVLFDRAVCFFTNGLDNACLRDNEGLTPLHIAAHIGSFHALYLILSYCPQSAEVYDHTGRTVLHYLNLSDYKELRLFLHLPNINALKNVKDCDGNTPAHLAVNNGNFTLVKVLHESSADFFLRNKTGVTVEDLIELERPSPSKLELNKRAVLNKKNVKEINQIGKLMDKELYTAVVNGDKEVLDEIISRDTESGSVKHEDAYFLTQTRDGSNIIHIALLHGKDKAVSFVQEAMKRFPTLILQKDSNGDTPIHLAAKWETFLSQVFLAQLVDDYGKAMDHETSGRCAAAMFCCRSPFLSVWTLKNSQGNMAIHEALRHSNFVAAQFFLHLDPDAAFHVNDAGETPLHVFARCAIYPVSCLGVEFNYVKSVRLDFLEKLILKNISAVCTHDGDGLTPVMRAAMYGRNTVVVTLLKHVPQSAHLQDPLGRTFLHMMQFHGREYSEGSIDKIFKDAAKRLFEIAEADVVRAVKDSEGNTPLHYALKTGNSILAKVLLWRCSEKKARNLEFAATNDEGKAIQQLLLSDELPNEVLEIYQKKVPQFRFSWFKSSYGLRRGQIKDSVSTLSVIAALIATITFAAAFQVPGGMDNNNGSPLLLNKAAFLVFLVFDAFALCCSTIVLFSLLWVMGSSRTRDSLLLIDLSIFLLQSSFYATLVSFMTGVYVTTAHKKTTLWLAIFVCVLCSIVTVVTHNTLFLFLIRFIADLRVRLINRWHFHVLKVFKAKPLDNRKTREQVTWDLIMKREASREMQEDHGNYSCHSDHGMSVWDDGLMQIGINNMERDI